MNHQATLISSSGYVGSANFSSDEIPVSSDRSSYSSSNGRSVRLGCQSVKATGGAEENSACPHKSLFSRFVERVFYPIKWLVDSHLLLSYGVNAILFSAQLKHITPKCFRTEEVHSPSEAREIIDRACNKQHADGFRVEKIKIPFGEGTIDAVICYPPGSKPDDRYGECLVFSNMNGKTISLFFDEEGRLSTTSDGDENGAPTDTPGNLQKLLKRPIILCDYPGTGMNQKTGVWQYIPTATPEALYQSGEAVLKYALNRFGKVTSVGSSMGGGIATKAFQRLVEKAGESAEDILKRVTLVNHDSYDTTSKVAIPWFPRIANAIGQLLGAHVDAKTSMEALLEKKAKVIILSHEVDSTIPKKARMIHALPESEKFLSYNSPLRGHSNLSQDQVKALENFRVELAKRTRPVKFS